MTAALRRALVIPTADGGSKARPSCAIIKSPPAEAMTSLMAFHRKTDRLNVWTVVIIRPDLLNEIRLDAPGKLLRRHIAFITFFNLKAICRENILWSKETWKERKSDAEEIEAGSKQKDKRTMAGKALYRRIHRWCWPYIYKQAYLGVMQTSLYVIVCMHSCSSMLPFAVSTYHLACFFICIRGLCRSHLREVIIPFQEVLCRREFDFLPLIGFLKSQFCQVLDEVY